MRTAADKVDVASDRRRRENVPRHILCSAISRHAEIVLARMKYLLCDAIWRIRTLMKCQKSDSERIGVKWI